MNRSKLIKLAQFIDRNYNGSVRAFSLQNNLLIKNWIWAEFKGLSNNDKYDVLIKAREICA